MSIDHQDDETRVWHKTSWRSFCWALVLTGLVRCAVMVAMHGNLDGDHDAYRKLAGNVVATGVYGWKTGADDPASDASGGEVLPTAFRPPLYPLLLIGIGGFSANWPVAVFHCILGVATAGLVAWMACRAGLGQWSLAAALLVGLDPILLQQSTLVMTETLATFLAALALFCLYVQANSRSSWLAVVTGAVIGVCALCRPTFLPWLALIAVTRVGQWRNIRNGQRSPDATQSNDVTSAKSSASKHLVDTALLVSGALLVLAPWVVRNQVVLGKAKLTTTHGGYTVLLGNNPQFYRFLNSDSDGVWDGEELGRAWQRRSLTTGPDDDQWNDLPRLAQLPKPQPATNASSELDDDGLAYGLAQRYIREQPGMFVFASGSRITRLWRWVPHRVGESESMLRLTLRYLVGVWYAVVFGLAIYGFVQMGRVTLEAPWVFGVQLCFVFTAVHTLYWSDMRMRAPLMPLICMAAASGLAAAYARLQSRKA